MARFASGFHGFGLWDFPILHGPLRLRDRGTMFRPLRVMLGPCEEVEGVGPGYVAPGSVGDPHLRVMVNVGV